MDRLRVGIIFGGRSEEHAVSVRSAQEIARNLDVEEYEPFYIGITKSGTWKLCDGPDADWENGGSRPAVLSPDSGVHGLLVLEQERYRVIRLDVVFPVLHGKLGEDGAMQGLLELSGIPYVGSGVQSSALCMDKSLAYIVARDAGIATLNYRTVTADEGADSDRVTLPVAVQPARAGSSFGGDRLKVGVIFGGCSEEHPISIKSAREVAKSLDLEKYQPFYIGITKTGAWKLCDGPDSDWENGGCRPAVLSPDRSVHGLLVLEQDQYKMIRLDVVLPVLHGKLGEDGAIQGLLELSGIPYVGCDVQSSALCMDKSLAYIVARNAGIATPNYWTVAADEKIDPDQLTYPVFVKPARSGSSFGVSKVSREEELSSAMETARQYDSKVLIEEAVVGSEVGCAILGEQSGLVAGEVDQISLSHGFFRIHQESEPERGSENSTTIVPADIPEESRSLVQETAKAIYRAFGCTGLARVDMFLTEDGTAVLNEVNTLPGMTSYSRYPRMMAAAGLPLSEVIDRIVSLTLHGKR